MARGSDITFVVSYKCPHCGVPLEGKSAQADAWLSCPSCGKASKPPDHAVTPEAARPVAGEDVLVIGPSSGPDPAPMTGRAARRDPFPSADLGSPVRVAYAAGLFVTVALLVFAYLDQSDVGIAGFAGATAVFLVLLAWPTPTRERV